MCGGIEITVFVGAFSGHAGSFGEDQHGGCKVGTWKGKGFWSYVQNEHDSKEWTSQEEGK